MQKYFFFILQKMYEDIKKNIQPSQIKNNFMKMCLKGFSYMGNLMVNVKK
jgi:hypothetical protein